jgi:rhodanese-related sulfurtransferase
LKTQISIKDENVDENGEKMVPADRPFLLLDIRPAEQYESGHIVSARSYPHVRLTRAVNFETQEMLAYKNRESKLIVVYDFDEGIAAKFTTTMMERGYDNVFMLSGGLRVAYIKFPERLVTKGAIEDMEGNEKINDEDILVIESFLEEALTNTDVRLNNYAPSTLNDQRSMAQTPSITSSRMQKPAQSTHRDGSMSRGSHLSDAQKIRSASPGHKKRLLPFTHRPQKASTLFAANMHKR